jgi:hypothetical protein
MAIEGKTHHEETKTPLHGKGQMGSGTYWAGPNS